MALQNFAYAEKVELNVDGNVYKLDDSKFDFSIHNSIIPIQNKCMFAFILCEYFDMRITNEMNSPQVQDLLHTQELSDVLDLSRQAKDFVLKSTRSAENTVTQIKNSITYYNNATDKYFQAASKCDKLMQNTDPKNLKVLDLLKNSFIAKSKYYNLCIQKCEIILEAYTSRR